MMTEKLNLPRHPIFSAIPCLCTCLAIAAYADEPSAVNLAPDVAVRQIDANLWMHTSTKRFPGDEIIPSNGLLDITGNEIILIDTAWNDRQTREICDWAAASLGRHVKMAIVTHAHSDRIGGVGYLHAQHIPVFGLKMTADIASKRNVPGSDQTFTLPIGTTTQLEGLELFYLGPGHAPDNIVIWFAAQRILFGGCLIKSASDLSATPVSPTGRRPSKQSKPDTHTSPWSSPATAPPATPISSTTPSTSSPLPPQHNPPALSFCIDGRPLAPHIQKAAKRQNKSTLIFQFN
jgi:metallo-beta-lactamase class B